MPLTQHTSCQCTLFTAGLGQDRCSRRQSLLCYIQCTFRYTSPHPLHQFTCTTGHPKQTPPSQHVHCSTARNTQGKLPCWGVSCTAGEIMQPTWMRIDKIASATATPNKQRILRKPARASKLPAYMALVVTNNASTCSASTVFDPALQCVQQHSLQHSTHVTCSWTLPTATSSMLHAHCITARLGTTHTREQQVPQAVFWKAAAGHADSPVAKPCAPTQ